MLELRRRDVIREIDEPGGKSGDSRESIWSLVSASKNWYLSIFTILAVSGEAVVVTREVGRHDGIIEIWYAVLTASDDVVTMAAGAAFTITEIGRNAMVLAHSLQKWLNKKLREGDEKFRNKLRAEGREEERQLWAEWNARRKDAASRGEEFTEPHP